MLRFVPFCSYFLGVLTILPGCCGSAAECERAPMEAEIWRIEDRYALGSHVRIEIRGPERWTLASSDPEIVRIGAVEWIGANIGRATLHFIGAGRASIIFESELGVVVEEEVEVLAHQRVVVRLGETTGLVLGPLSGEVILAGDQHVLVLYLDAQGRLLHGAGLAELRMSSGLEPCGTAASASIEQHCISVLTPGPHLLAVRVEDERLELPFEAVLANDVVDVELLAADESELMPGTWVEVDVVGVTREGTRVRGVHPRFQAGERLYLGYLTYRHDPAGMPRTIAAQALGRQRRITVHGSLSEKNEAGQR